MADDIKRRSGSFGYTIEEHPSYGMVGLTQTTGKANLFGSRVSHQTYITLTIKEAERHVDAYTEHFMAKHEPVAQICISSAQLADLLTTMNRGDGVPCTIRYIKGDEAYRPEPPEASHFKESQEALKSTLLALFEKSREMAKKAETLVKKGSKMTTQDREQIQFLALKIHQDIESNMVFAAKCFDEKMEKTVTHAKAEMEAFVSQMVRSTGIKALQEMRVKEIEDKTEEPT